MAKSRLDIEPKISLAMPVFNGASFVAETLQSLLSQDFEDFELIVTDNDSSDGTADIVLDFAARDARVRYHHNGKNLGAANNYNRGFDLSRGTYLKWCAHDDNLSPNFLSACLRALEEDPQASLAFGVTERIDDDGKSLGRPVGEMETVADDDPARRFYRSITEAATCYPIFGLFRKAVLSRTTLHRPYYGSDRGLIAEAALLGPCVQVADAIFYNREHASRSINITDLSVRSRWQNGTADRKSAMEHINLLAHLIEISGRHRGIASPFHIRRALMPYIFHPYQLGRYSLDTIRYLSPEAALRMKQFVLGQPRRERQLQG